MCRLDEHARALVEDNLGLVYFVLGKMGVSRGSRDFDDVFGAGCVGLCNAARVYRDGGCAFSTFAFYIIKNEALRVLEARKKEKSRQLPLDGVCGRVAAAGGEFEKAEARLLLEEFERCSKRNLGETAAGVFRLLASGRSCAEAAQKLGISLSAAEKAKKRAADAMKIFLGEVKC